MSKPQPLTVGSTFSGIGGFDEGFRRAGFDIRWMCERESFCQKVLARHFAGVPCFDDVETLGELESVDVLVGGFPCQDVSVAGKRVGLLSGERSGLFFAFRDLAARLKPLWLVIENVPGLLSSHGGRDFHTVLSALAELGFRRSYRILDSQYFGVAQRRRRVFLVLSLGAGRRHTRTVLFESEGGERRAQAGAEGAEAGAHVAATLRGRSARRGVNEPGRGGEDDSNLVAIGVHANQRGELRTSPVAGSLNSSKSGKQYEGMCVAFDWQSGGDVRHNVSDKPSALQANQTPAVAFTLKENNRNTSQGPGNYVVAGERERALTASMHKRHDEDTDTLIASALTASAGHHGHSSPRGDGTDNLVAATLLSGTGGNRTTDLNQTFTPTRYGVRRLTPLECERVQGFPDGWTCLCGEGHRGSRFCKCKDTPRYKALGNAVTVPVAQWIASRILEAEARRGQRLVMDKRALANWK